MCGLLPSIWLVVFCFLFFFACILSVVVDMSQIMPICYFLWKEEVRSPQAVFFLIWSLLRSDAKTIEGEECARLNTSCENSKQLSVQFSAGPILSLHLHICPHHLLTLFHLAGLTNGTCFDVMRYILEWIVLSLIGIVLPVKISLITYWGYSMVFLNGFQGLFSRESSVHQRDWQI